jgi:hypothetical protein
MKFLMVLVTTFLICSPFVMADEDAEAYAYFKEAREAFEHRNYNKAERLLIQATSIRAKDETLILNKQSRSRFYSGSRGIETIRVIEGDKVDYFPNRILRQIESERAQWRVTEQFEVKKQNPPVLAYFTRLVDLDNDGRFYADEPLELYIHLQNRGQSSAEDLQVTIESENGLASLNTQWHVPALAAGDTKIISTQFTLPRDYQLPELLALVRIDEKDGFSPKPLEVSYQIQAWEPPQLDIVPLHFPAVLVAGQSQEYEYLLRNKGRSPVRQFSLRTELSQPGLTIISENWPDHFSLFKAGDELKLRVIVKAAIDLEPEKMPQLEWVLEDKGNTDAADRFTRLAGFDLPVEKPINGVQIENYSAIGRTLLTQQAMPLHAGELLKPAQLLKRKHARGNDFALVIGNRDYTKAKNQSVAFALKDAQLMRDVFTHNLGLPDSNVLTQHNATLGELNTLLGDAGEPGQFQTIINHHAGLVDTVYVYYSGHGVPAMNKAWSAYLMPSDANPYYIDKSGYSLETFYDQLSLINARQIVVFLDACFSGNSAAGSLFPNTSAGLLKAPAIPLPNEDKRITVFSATDSEGVALWLEEVGQGLFTHFLAKGLSGEADNGDKQLNLKELYEYVHDHVKQVSAMKQARQSPSLFKRSNLALVTYE